MFCEATFSCCGSYRYTLTRTWDADAPKLLFVLLNPSRASDVLNDLTVMHCQNVAYALGRLGDLPENPRISEMPAFGSYRVCNLFAWIATDTTGLTTSCPQLIGPQNDRFIAQSCGWADHIVCAWGSSRLKSKPRRRDVESLIRDHDKPVWRFNPVAGQRDPCHPLAFGTMDANPPNNPPAFHKLIANLRRWQVPSDPAPHAR